MNTLHAATGIQQDDVDRTARQRLEADACMFCDESLGLARTGEDPLAFRDHLARHDHCQREYQLWKQVITDEWLGD